VGQRVQENQVLASAVAPLPVRELACRDALTTAHLKELALSPERTERFTAIKLARLRQDQGLEDKAAEMARDAREDVYTRLEAAAYLASTCGGDASALFSPFLNNADDQIRLEAVVALAEAKTDEAVEVLSLILDDANAEYFLRSAAAWALGRLGTDSAIRRLINCFADFDIEIRQEALVGLADLRGSTVRPLLEGLNENDQDIAAGCAEAIRRFNALPPDAVMEIKRLIESESDPVWPVWLMGSLKDPLGQIAEAVAELQESKPEAHYAISVLLAFTSSWISKHWESYPNAG
jgi:HEAT repeat protein